jgi:hypothetical protein
MGDVTVFRIAAELLAGIKQGDDLECFREVDMFLKFFSTTSTPKRPRNSQIQVGASTRRHRGTEGVACGSSHPDSSRKLDKIECGSLPFLQRRRRRTGAFESFVPVRCFPNMSRDPRSALFVQVSKGA